MKSTWNRTCFPNPPGCCMIVSNTIRTGLAGHQRKPMSRLSSLRQLKLTPVYRIGPARAYLVYFTQPWRSLPSMFVFGTIEATPSIIRTRCNYASLTGTGPDMWIRIPQPSQIFDRNLLELVTTSRSSTRPCVSEMSDWWKFRNSDESLFIQNRNSLKIILVILE